MSAGSTISPCALANKAVATNRVKSRNVSLIPRVFIPAQSFPNATPFELRAGDVLAHKHSDL